MEFTYKQSLSQNIYTGSFQKQWVDSWHFNSSESVIASCVHRYKYNKYDF